MLTVIGELTLKMKNTKGVIMEKYGFICNDVRWMIDPLDKYHNLLPQDIVTSLGFVPSFIYECPNVVEEAFTQYQFPCGGAMGGTATKEGVYQFPGDPDLYPLAMCQAGGKKIYQYQYGIVSFVDIKTEEHETYRFD